jgi:hypothetical protein
MSLKKEHCEDVITKGESSALGGFPFPRRLASRRVPGNPKETTRPAGFARPLDCCREPSLSLVLSVLFVDARREALLFLTHMSLFAQVMLHKTSRVRNNGDRLG